MNESTQASGLSRVAQRVKRLLAKPITVGWLGAIVLVSALGGLWFGMSARKQTAESQNQGADLTSFIRTVRKQLEQVETDRVIQGEPALFKLKDFDLELSIIATNTAKGTGEVKAEVVTVGMGQELSHEVSQKIVLHMGLAPPETITIEEALEPISTNGAVPLPTRKLEKRKK